MEFNSKTFGWWQQTSNEASFHSGPRTRRGRSLAVGESGASSNEKREEEADANARLLKEVYLGEEQDEETFLIKERWRKENSVMIDRY